VEYNPPFDLFLNRTIQAGVHRCLQANGTLAAAQADAETKNAL